MESSRPSQPTSGPPMTHRPAGIRLGSTGNDDTLAGQRRSYAGDAIHTGRHRETDTR
ncbi:hypothetical protein I552_0751 [Mycobacterium xenopi 3993]|nr:hypothetical protein I552_0751 [Mycobacterium xenopi 3993]